MVLVLQRYYTLWVILLRFLSWPIVSKGQNQVFTVGVSVKILKIGTPEIITIIVLQLEQLDFTVQYCV